MSILSTDDLVKLTGCKQARTQERTLRERGIPFRQSGPRIIVLEQHVAAWIEGRRIPQFAGPDLSCVK